jgi:competence protein ComEC
LGLILAGVVVGTTGWAHYWWRERLGRDELRITHLSVGHGDAAVVEFPGAKVLLIDAGGTASGEFDTGEAVVAPFLRSRKISKVDYLLLAHPRVDHYGGLKSIVEQFAPEEFWSGSGRIRSDRYRDLEGALEKANVKRQVLDRRDGCRTIERIEFCVVHASADASEDPSLAVRLAYENVSFLFAGDMDSADEKAFLGDETRPLISTVVKVPRHGSASSSTEAFVSTVQPRIAIFSVGYRNPFGLPREEVVTRYRQRGADILRTDIDGAIILQTDGKTLRYQTTRSGKRKTVQP